MRTPTLMLTIALAMARRTFEGRVVNGIAVALTAIVLSSTSAHSLPKQCNPNEGCNKCMVHNPFGGCIVYGNDPDCEVRKKICRDTNIPIPPAPTPPKPVDLNTCIQNPGRCPESILKNNPIAVGQPIMNAYLNDLRGQANGRWQSLPTEFIAEFAPHYPQIDMKRVRYANNINTRHGQSMTLCYEVFLAGSFDDDERSSLAHLLHELYHTVQCVNRGGVGPFVDEYLAHGIGTIVQKRSFNIHDDIDHERDAEQRSRSLITAFGWPFVIDNDCPKHVQLLVRAQEASGRWSTVGWYKFEPGQKLQLLNDSGYLHSTNGSWSFYAEEAGSGHKWSGDQEIEFGGERYMAVQKHTTQPGEHFAARLTCQVAAGRGTTESTVAPPLGAPGVSSRAPKQFTYNYVHQPLGPMRWTKVTQTRWREDGPDGGPAFFDEVDRTTIDGTSGTVVRRSGDTLEIFIPDLIAAGRQPRLLRQRHSGTNRQWAPLGDMVTGK